MGFDSLLVAIGARAEEAYPGAGTFRGLQDADAMHGLLQDVEGGYTKRIAFVVPPGVTWSLPLYELALMTAERAYSLNLEVQLTIVTPEDEPLAIFGKGASESVDKILADAGITVIPNTHVRHVSHGEVVASPGDVLVRAERVVALPRLEGPGVRGLRADAHGFLPVDDLCRVVGTDHVFAAGDGTTFAIKQGGIAAQQADTVARAIAARAGADVAEQPFRPVLRAKLLTGSQAKYLREAVTGGTGDSASTLSDHTPVVAADEGRGAVPVALPRAARHGRGRRPAAVRTAGAGSPMPAPATARATHPAASSCSVDDRRRPVVVGYDGSETARAAVTHAVTMAHGGRVVVVHAHHEPPPQLTSRWRELLTADRPEEGRAVLDAILLEGNDELADAEWEGRLAPDAPAEAIVRVAGEVDADAIVVGSRGYGSLSAMLGSVSHELLRISDRPGDGHRAPLRRAASGVKRRAIGRCRRWAATGSLSAQRPAGRAAGSARWTRSCSGATTAALPTASRCRRDRSAPRGGSAARPRSAGGRAAPAPAGGTGRRLA